MARSKKRPGQRETPRGGKCPRCGVAPPGVETQSISWSIGILDRNGTWGWGRVGVDTLWTVIKPKLRNFETMSWPDIESAGSHLISLGDITREAYRRLEEIRQDDTDSLFSLRLSGTNRIWGIRDRNVLRILWWDPDHTVYPSNKQYT